MTDTLVLEVGCEAYKRIMDYNFIVRKQPHTVKNFVLAYLCIYESSKYFDAGNEIATGYIGELWQYRLCVLVMYI